MCVSLEKLPKMSSKKRVCLLTGAAGRLGTAFCRRFAFKYDIIAVYHTSLLQAPTQDQTFVDPLEPARDLPENASPVFAIQADLADERELKRVTELALTHSGRIDLLANVAAWSLWAPLLESSGTILDSMEYQFLINSIVPVKLACIIAGQFWASRIEENIAFNRNVVNLSSMGGIQVYPDAGQSVYAATKAALNQFTYHMASEFWSIGVRVNAIASNAFPEVVPIETVAGSIVRLDEISATGKILVLDGSDQYYL